MRFFPWGYRFSTWNQLQPVGIILGGKKTYWLKPVLLSRRGDGAAVEQEHHT